MTNTDQILIKFQGSFLALSELIFDLRQMRESTLHQGGRVDAIDRSLNNIFVSLIRQGISRESARKMIYGNN